MRIKLCVVSFLFGFLIPDLSFAQDSCVDPEKDSPCTNFERYRSYNGRCNNLNYPEQGAANDVQQRILPAEYDDNVSSPKLKAVSGPNDRRNPREVSQIVHSSNDQSNDELDSELTVMVMQWGQFIDHDLTLTPHDTTDQCEKCDFDNEDKDTCFSIKIPQKDDFFTRCDIFEIFCQHIVQCFKFQRSKAKSVKGVREQTNKLTSYLDASMVYGSNKCVRNTLRENKPKSHHLRTRDEGLVTLLPQTDNSACPNSRTNCFLAGDNRVNEQPGLTSLHIILVREHNRIAEELMKMNEHWDRDKIFEETRRIITAQIQHITYNEFLPRVLGPYGLNNFDLDLKTSGFYSDYDNSCSATSYNEFSTAAFRFGHSMIPSHITTISNADELGNTITETYPLHDLFFNPDIFTDNGGKLDDLLRGLTMTPMHKTNRHVTEEVKNHLFQKKDQAHSGMDLPALNIQRGRDHGLPGYNKYRQFCKLPKATKFADLNNEMSADTISKLRLVYTNPDDIDLYTGLLSETHLPGAITGPTLACIIGLQFKNIRKCDRYWYETSDPEIKFSENQLQEIRSSSLAALICKNMDENSKIARSVMDLVNDWTNPLVDCEQSIKSIDLEAWREPEECRNHNMFTNKGRKTGSTGYWGCDSTIEGNQSPDWQGPGWYRFVGDAGDMMQMSAPKTYAYGCGTNVGIWLASPLPAQVGESLEAIYCEAYDQHGENCKGKLEGMVTKCKDDDDSTFFVYKLPTTGCTMRYCGTNSPNL